MKGVLKMLTLEVVRNKCAEYGATTVLCNDNLTIISAGSELHLHVLMDNGCEYCPDVMSFSDIWDGGLINDATFYHPPDFSEKLKFQEA